MWSGYLLVMRYIISERQVSLLVEQEVDFVFSERLKEIANIYLESVFEPFEFRNYHSKPNDLVQFGDKDYFFVKNGKIFALITFDKNFLIERRIVESLSKLFLMPTDESVKKIGQFRYLEDVPYFAAEHIKNWVTEKYGLDISIITTVDDGGLIPETWKELENNNDYDIVNF